MINFKLLFDDILNDKFPEIASKENIKWKLNHLDSSINVLSFNNLMFYNSVDVKKNFDSRLKSYTAKEILRILNYQILYNKSNTEIINKFGMSRSTLIFWKKRYKELFKN